MVEADIRQMPNEDYSSPGPMYNTAELGRKEKVVTHRLGTSQRTKINHWVEKTPAPNHYHSPGSPKAAAVSIPKADPKVKIEDFPEAGCYNPELKGSKKKAVSYSLGSRYQSIMD